MKTLFASVMAVASIAGAVPASAQAVIQTGPLPVTTYTQCEVPATYVLNPRGRRLTRGGWGTNLAAGQAPGQGAQWERSYANDVWVARRTLRSLPYTYLDPNGAFAPCAAPGF